MDKKAAPLVSPFDELVTPPHLQTMKLLIPYTPMASQRRLGILIKYMEFQQTVSFFNQPQNAIHSQAFGEHSAKNPLEILTALKPYLPGQQGAMLDSLFNAMNMVEMLKMAQTFQDSPPPAEGHSERVNPMDMMMGMLTPDQQNMFQMYQTMFTNDTNIDQKGETDHERVDEPSGHERSRSVEEGTDSDGSKPDQG